MIKEETMQKYTLGCAHCGETYYSNTAFPERLLCPDCRGLRKAGIEEVVEWIEANKCNAYGEGNRHYCPNCDHQIHGVPDYLWQAKLEEWGIKEGQ